MLQLSFSTDELELFLLVLVRISMFFVIAPFFSMTNAPNRVKIGLSVLLSVLIYSSLQDRTPVTYNSILGYTLIVLKEAVTGLLIGFAATLVTSVVSLAGNIVDMESGLSMMQIMDPATKQEISVTGGFYQYTIMLMMLLSGLHRYLIRAIADTFVLIPINGTVFHMDGLVNAICKFMAQYISIGFRICLPVFATMVLLNAILGILAKIAPQMNMFAVGIQLKILVALIILFLTVWMLPDAAQFIYDEMKHMVVTVVEALA